jgi:hypothetical protein
MKTIKNMNKAKDKNDRYTEAYKKMNNIAPKRFHPRRKYCEPIEDVDRRAADQS